MSQYITFNFCPNTFITTPIERDIEGLGLYPYCTRARGIGLYKDWKRSSRKWMIHDTPSWECSDREAVQWLLEQTYQVKDGYLDVKAFEPCR